jgi:hypothetical protein
VPLGRFLARHHRIWGHIMDDQEEQGEDPDNPPIRQMLA